jgi:hypothetical protein
MANRLLDRQRSLLEYLTSSHAIFGEGGGSLDPALQGLDVGLLRLEARFSYEKRMEKVAAAFPRTFEILESQLTSVVREFVAACPPVDIGRLANACQFHEFLSACWRHEPPQPPYLPDVVTCELACAAVRAAVEEEEQKKGNGKRRNGIRRRPGVALLRCAYDIRPIFENNSTRAIPVKRETLIAVTILTGASDPQVFEVLPIVFDFLAALDDWTDPTAFGVTPDLDGLIRELEGHQLLEVRA